MIWGGEISSCRRFAALPQYMRSNLDHHAMLFLNKPIILVKTHLFFVFA